MFILKFVRMWVAGFGLVFLGRPHKHNHPPSKASKLFATAEWQYKNSAKVSCCW